MRSLFFPQIVHPAGNSPRPDGPVLMPVLGAPLLPEAFISAEVSSPTPTPPRGRTGNETTFNVFARCQDGAFAEQAEIGTNACGVATASFP